MRFSSVLSWLGVSLHGGRGSRPSSTQAVESTEIADSELTPTPAVVAGLENTEEVESEPDYIEEPYDFKTTDMHSQSYLPDRGYYASVFPNGETRVYSEHYDEFGAETMLSIYFDEDHKVTSFRNDNSRHEENHEYKLPLHKIFLALSYSGFIDYIDMDWIVMDVFDRRTLELIDDYRESNNLGIEEDIRLTEKDRYWHTFSNTHYYKEASHMIPARIDKIVIRRQERWIEGTNYPATVAHLIMFSFKSFDSKGRDPPATDPSEIRAMEVLGAAIKAVDENEAANLKKQLKIGLEADADALDDVAEAASEKSDTEPASEAS